MAGGIRFTKTELAEVKAGLEWRSKLTVNRPGRGPESTAGSKQALNALDKIEKAELLGKKKASGISVAAALEAFRGVLGKRLLVPPSPGPSWYAKITRRLADLGVTAGDCKTIAKVAGEKWNGWIKAESLVNQAEALLQESQLELPHVGQVNARAPRRMGSDMDGL